MHARRAWGRPPAAEQPARVQEKKGIPPAKAAESAGRGRGLKSRGETRGQKGGTKHGSESATRRQAAAGTGRTELNAVLLRQGRNRATRGGKRKPLQGDDQQQKREEKAARDKKEKRKKRKKERAGARRTEGKARAGAGKPRGEAASGRTGMTVEDGARRGGGRGGEERAGEGGWEDKGERAARGHGPPLCGGGVPGGRREQRGALKRAGSASGKASQGSHRRCENQGSGNTQKRKQHRLSSSRGTEKGGQENRERSRGAGKGASGNAGKGGRQGWHRAATGGGRGGGREEQTQDNGWAAKHGRRSVGGHGEEAEPGPQGRAGDGRLKGPAAADRTQPREKTVRRQRRADSRASQRQSVGQERKKRKALRGREDRGRARKNDENGEGGRGKEGRWKEQCEGRARRRRRRGQRGRRRTRQQTKPQKKDQSSRGPQRKTKGWEEGAQRERGGSGEETTNEDERAQEETDRQRGDTRGNDGARGGTRFAGGAPPDSRERKAPRKAGAPANRPPPPEPGARLGPRGTRGDGGHLGDRGTWAPARGARTSAPDTHTHTHTHTTTHTGNASHTGTPPRRHGEEAWAAIQAERSQQETGGRNNPGPTQSAGETHRGAAGEGTGRGTEEGNDAPPPPSSANPPPPRGRPGTGADTQGRGGKQHGCSRDCTEAGGRQPKRKQIAAAAKADEPRADRPSATSRARGGRGARAAKLRKKPNAECQ
ncbi:unnamed protein product [Pleuronectes platessa]|uniref:Uncharacterized protein n=1 Tax=Pleuronectes platessa TaxID=8262 RepID=A0A9N7UTG0_PLEPL|nr:unnamed protein product [Pleuronectes platessa]